MKCVLVPSDKDATGCIGVLAEGQLAWHPLRHLQDEGCADVFFQQVMPA